MLYSHLALEKIKSFPNIHSILDIGCGRGEHSAEFIKKGIEVTAVDIVRHPEVPVAAGRFYQGAYDELTILKQFDCVWMSHVLEHQLNVNNFLKKAVSNTKEGGYLAITVPPLKNQIVGGHVSIWNAGLVMYNLILAGTSCKSSMVKKYGYNISIIVKKESIALPQLKFDCGDIESLSDFFPKGYNFHGFNGDILDLNW